MSTPGEVSLHLAVDTLARQLHHYVDVAVGVRQESVGDSADDDPRLEEAERLVGLDQARLQDAIRTELGLDADLTMLIWEQQSLPTDTGADEEESGLLADTDDFFLHTVVAAPGGSAPDRLDAVLDVLEDAGRETVRRLEAAGFLVVSVGIARGDVIGLTAGIVLDDDGSDDSSDGGRTEGTALEEP